jgi:uncharacterized protein (DUF433 family)
VIDDEVHEFELIRGQRLPVDRIDAGESVEDVARDYDVTTDVIEEAVVFERAA